MSRIILLIVLSSPQFHDRFGQKLLVEVDTQEGRLIQQIDNEKDPENKFRLLEKFAKALSRITKLSTWVLSHMQAHYLETKEYDKVLATGTGS